MFPSTSAMHSEHPPSTFYQDGRKAPSFSYGDISLLIDLYKKFKKTLVLYANMMYNTIIKYKLNTNIVFSCN